MYEYFLKKKYYIFLRLYYCYMDVSEIILNIWKEFNFYIVILMP